MKKVLLLTLTASLLLAAPATASIEDYSDVDPYSMDHDDLAEAFIDLRANYNALFEVYRDYLMKYGLDGPDETEAETDGETGPKVPVEEATAGMLVAEDDFTGDKSFYSTKTHVDEGRYIGTVTSRPPFYSWLNQDGSTGEVTIAVKYQYYSDDWIFFDQVHLKTGDTTYDFDLSHIISNHEVKDGGKVLEYYNIKPGSDMISAFRDLVANGSGKLRFEGRSYHKDYDISQEAIEGLEEILNAYDAINGL